MKNVENTRDLRELLTDEIKLLREGKSNPGRSNAIANMVGKILSSVKLDLEVHKYVAKADAADLSVALLERKTEK